MRAWILPVLLTLILVPSLVQAQSPPRLVHRFFGDPGALNLDLEGRGSIDFRLGAEVGGFACAKPVEVRFDVHIESTHPAWANAAAAPPHAMRFLPPGPIASRIGHINPGTLSVVWDVAKAPLDAREKYVLRATLVPPDFGGCAPTPVVVAGSPDRWNATVCLKPQVGGYGNGCTDLKPLALGAAKESPMPESVALIGLMAVALVLRRRR